MPHKDPEKRRAAARARYKANPVRAKTWEIANPEKVRAVRRRSAYLRKYGVTFEQAKKALLAQDGACAICKKDILHYGMKDGRKRAKFHADHNHTTGAFRGFLCNGCNTLLGLANDDPAMLEAAAAYLRQQPLL